jgi:hypothetical protein
MPWFRIVATVAAMEPSLFMPARMKITAMSKRPSAEMEETSAFIALSVFITHPRVSLVVWLSTPAPRVSGMLETQA